MPEQWSKLLTKSAITREDYARDPQAVLDVLEFSTDHKKRGLEEMITSRGPSSSGGGLSPYPSLPESTGAPARFNAGTGLGGVPTLSTPPALTVEQRQQ